MKFDLRPKSNYYYHDHYDLSLVAKREKAHSGFRINNEAKLQSILVNKAHSSIT